MGGAATNADRLGRRNTSQEVGRGHMRDPSAFRGFITSPVSEGGPLWAWTALDDNADDVRVGVIPDLMLGPGRDDGKVTRRQLMPAQL